MMRIPGPAEAVLTVERGLQVLRAFRSERAALSNAELARRTGLPKSAVSKLTSTLLQLGLVDRAPGGRLFELIPGALASGHAFVGSSPLLSVVDPVLRQLSEDASASTAMTVPDGVDMICIASCAPARIGAAGPHVGSLLPMATTAAGRAYLWALPGNERSQQLARLLQRAAEHEPGIEAAIHSSFLELDQTGTCCVSDAMGATLAVALPLKAGRQNVLMSLSCVAPSVTSDVADRRKRLASALRSAVQRIVELLAHSDGRP
jgi:IclR family transcriptional regulator, positive regulator for flagellar biogenesis